MVEVVLLHRRADRDPAAARAPPRLRGPRPHHGDRRDRRRRMHVMTNENESLIRGAYEAYARGDIATMLEIVDPDLEWTYLDPGLPDPQPDVCHGRGEL